MTRLRRILFVLIVGVGGVALLLWLGAWQVERLTWKQGVLAEIDERLQKEAIFIEGKETPEIHNFRRAIAEGVFSADEVPARFLTSLRPFGAGHRVIHPFELRRGRWILVDRGYVRAGEAIPPPPEGLVALSGVLHWPRERGAFTPDANREDRLWFARDVEEIADELRTQPVMLVLNENQSRSPIAVPVTVDIPNNHLAYAVTWYSLAVVWFVMTIVLLRRGARA